MNENNIGHKSIEYKLISILGSDNVIKEADMSSYTTFRIGGIADYVVTPENEEQLAKLLHLIKEESVDFVVIGNGSNILVSDNGFDGIVIQLGDKFSSFVIKDKDESGVYVDVTAGMRLSRLGNELAAGSIEGFEFATGIPGTIGGAVMMNAGAYGGEIKDIIKSARVMDFDGNVKELSRDELELGYRTSIIAKKNYIVISAVFGLKKGDREKIKSTIKELALKRREKQPLEYPSAGSTFKRPEGYFAAKLIEDAGLKGLSVGGAQVSEKHAGFVINKKDAKAMDVIRLTDEIKEKVYDKFGVKLELEIKKIGF
ncbi:MAG: UDP-N-acetylmuramate dehydrogenase [Lachnospira sp.]|nr:UDP-N-acetylmuramate dehydrogenase [Lachnospira sp.]